MKVWFEGNQLFYENLLFHINEDEMLPEHWIAFDEPIETIKQLERTVFIKCETKNFIGVEIGYPGTARILHEYSHEIPTWMKQEFDRWLKGGMKGEAAVQNIRSQNPQN